MNTNIAHDLKQTVTQIRVHGRTSKNTPFEFHGQKYPLKITKDFLGTFKPHDNLLVEIDGHRLCFKWKNGFAHINSLPE